MCACFFDIGYLLKTQAEHELSKIFDLQGQTIDVSYQAIFNLKSSGLHDEEIKKINVIDPLTAAQRISGRFLLFMMMVHPDQTEPKYKHNRMTCRACVQLPLYVYGIDTSIDTQILKTPHILLFHLVAFDNGRKPYIVTL